MSDDPTAQVFVMTPTAQCAPYLPLVPDDDPQQVPPSIRAVLLAAAIVAVAALVSAFVLSR